MSGAFKILVQQLVKGMSETMPIQDFPRPIVEHHLYSIDLGSRPSCEPRAFGKKLAQQAVGVLVWASLPTAVGSGSGRISKEYILPQTHRR